MSVFSSKNILPNRPALYDDPHPIITISLGLGIFFIILLILSTLKIWLLINFFCSFISLYVIFF